MFVRVADDLGYAWDSGQFFGGALRVTARHYDLSLRIFAVNAADGGTGVLVGRSCNGTGVEDDDLGAGCCVGALEALILELALNRGAVGLGRAAPKILYVKTRHHTIVAAYSGPSSTSGKKRAIALLIKQNVRTFLAQFYKEGKSRDAPRPSR